MTPEQKMLAIQYLSPGAEVTLRGNKMVWHDDRPKPTIAEIEAALGDAELAEQARSVRAQRDALLRSCDAKALPDYPHSSDAEKQAWLDYRQALRKLTEQEGFPQSITWPECPQ